ncbi:SWI/SNF-related matrix-associated actin-dependent regulator of chromatin subfamily A containing DEAD/H box 1B-like [Lineus longissimus]|uniref:SWI/SNF-related matrix-associated actin-dependent regulator of chromatin subfamily A containing DEAD/H box 1B-like n=1 Tax=Lineus longissimus TaxID=88925 RepID=UPI002B4DAF18
MSGTGISSLLKYRFQPNAKTQNKLQPAGTDSSQSSKNASSPSTSTPRQKDPCSKSSRNIFDDLKTSIPDAPDVQPSPLKKKTTLVQGRKGPVLSGDEEAGESDGPWLSKEMGTKSNGVAKTNKTKKRKRQPVVESESDLSFDEDEEDPFANNDLLNNGFPNWIKDEAHFKENVLKLKNCFPGKAEALIEKAIKRSRNFFDAENYVIKKTDIDHGSSQQAASQESDDCVIRFPAKKRARVLVSDDSFNADACDAFDDDDDDDDDDDGQGSSSNKPDKQTITARVGFLQEAFPDHSPKKLEEVLASCDYSVEDATTTLSTFQDDDLPDIKRARSLQEMKHHEKKNKNRQGRSNADGDMLSDCDFEVDEDEDFDSEESDLEDVVEEHPVRRRILAFFNDSTQQECSAVPGCSIKKVDVIIGLRPFENWADLVHKLDKHKLLAIQLIENCKTMLAMQNVVTKLMRKCEKISMDMGHLVTRLTAENNLIDDNLLQIMRQPKSLNPNFNLKPYQIIGLNWLLVMHKHDLNGILADEMGLGKTIQSIAFLAYLMEQGDPGPHLIIVPSSTIDNWNREIRIWCPEMKVLMYYGSQEERRDMRYQVQAYEETDFHVVLTTYNMATGCYDDRSFFKKINFHYCVIDEAHMLKNATSQRYQSMMKIRAKRRLLLTGTPLQNNLVELMSLLAFVMPEMFEGKGDLLKRTFKIVVGGNGNDRGSYEKQRINHAKNIMKPFVLRRLKSQVLKQLPKKIDIVKRCPLAFEQREGYDATIAEYKAFQAFREANPKQSTNEYQGATILMKLRKWAQHSLLQRVHYTEDKLRVMSRLMLSDPDHVAADPQLIFEDMGVMSDFELHKLCLQYPALRNLHLSDDIISDSGKFRLLDELLPELQQQGARILMFSQFVLVLDIIEDYMKIRGHKFCRLDGSTPVVERQALIDTFNSDESIFIFLLSTKAGGLGINLTAANTVILHDMDFNPYNDKQAEDRCHRVGQTKDVTVMRLICQNTVEEGIYNVAQRKLQLEEDVIANDREEDLGELDVASILKDALNVDL